MKYKYQNTPGFKRTPSYILEAQKQKLVGDEFTEKKHRRRRKKKHQPPVQEQHDAISKPLDADEEIWKWADIVRSPDTDFIRQLLEDMELKANREWVITINERTPSSIAK